MVRGWSTTQAVIALSSGEPEYYGMVKGASNGLGLRSIIADLGIDLSVILKNDSSAAKGIANRTGLGKVRHIEVAQLWLQDKVRSNEINVVKVKGTENVADALTKYVSAEETRWHVREVGQSIEEGRHPLNPLPDASAIEGFCKQTEDITNDYLV